MSVFKPGILQNPNNNRISQIKLYNQNSAMEIDYLTSAGLTINGASSGGAYWYLGGSSGLTITDSNSACGGFTVHLGGNGGQVLLENGNNAINTYSKLILNPGSGISIQNSGSNKITIENTALTTAGIDITNSGNGNIVVTNTVGDIILRNNSSFASAITVTTGGVIQLSPYNSYNEIIGGIKYACATVSISGTVVGYAHIVLFDTDTAGADITANLIPATGESGRVFRFKNTGATYNVIVEPDGVETIDGDPNFTLLPSEAIDIICNGTAWYIL